MREKNLLVQLPPAAGKTRVALGIILTLAKENHSSTLKVVFLHPTSILMDQDTEQFTKVQKLLESNQGSNVKLERYASFKEAKDHIDGDSVVIADEFDYQLFDKNDQDPFQLFQIPYRQFIALTATTPNHGQRMLDTLFSTIGFHHVVPAEQQLQH